MTRKKTLGDYSPEELQAELLRRGAVENCRREMTMSEMELLILDTCGMENPAALRHLQAPASTASSGAAAGHRTGWGTVRER